MKANYDTNTELWITECIENYFNPLDVNNQERIILLKTFLANIKDLKEKVARLEKINIENALEKVKNAVSLVEGDTK